MLLPEPPSSQRCMGRVRCLGIAALAATSVLVWTAAAEAKELSSFKACGASGCKAIKDPQLLKGLIHSVEAQGDTVGVSTPAPRVFPSARVPRARGRGDRAELRRVLRAFPRPRGVQHRSGCLGLGSARPCSPSLARPSDHRRHAVCHSADHTRHLGRQAGAGSGVVRTALHPQGKGRELSRRPRLEADRDRDGRTDAVEHERGKSRVLAEQERALAGQRVRPPSVRAFRAARGPKIACKLPDSAFSLGARVRRAGRSGTHRSADGSVPPPP
jgi:hypothetical protein